ncbi:alanyl-tRNA editing protein [Salinarimonas sp.]|uniref:alanyl-tRNA editing protein n=1 Tax=Salinarimonas sp. TaxID=2766526 RepID=UPI0032D8EEC9
MLLPGLTLPPTEKLFHVDAGLAEARARVIHVACDLVVLDRTIFYAESGGQVADRGTLAGVPVVDVRKEGGRPVRIERPGLDAIFVNTGTAIVHRLAEPAALEIGQEVALALDAEHRAAVRRHHTAAHFLFHALDTVLAGTVGERIATRGCVIDAEGFRFDIANTLPPERLAAVEARANGLAARALAIAMESDPACDDVFTWRYGEIAIPCGGTHVRHAREVPPMTLSRRSKGKAALRIAGRLEG